MKFFKKSPPPTIEVAPVQAPVKLVFGFPAEQKPIHGMPKGVAKLVYTAGEPALLVVATKEMDQTFTLEDRGEFWIPHTEIKREVLVK